MNRRITKGGLNVTIMSEQVNKLKLYLRGDLEHPLTPTEHAELLNDLKSLSDKYAFHVSVETKV